MAEFTTAQFTLGTAPVAVTVLHNQGIDVTFHNAAKSSNNKIYFGGSTVSTATGIHIDADGFLQLTLSPEHQLWAISDPAGIVLEVLEQRY